MIDKQIEQESDAAENTTADSEAAPSTAVKQDDADETMGHQQAELEQQPVAQSDADVEPATGSGGVLIFRFAKAFAWVMLVLLLITAPISLGISYHLWQQLQMVENDLKSRVQNDRRQWQHQVETLGMDVSKLPPRTEQLEHQVKDLAEQYRHVNEAMETLQKITGRERRQWIVAEVEYLMLVANQRLQLSGDVNTAIKALSSADDRLQDLADPALLSVRKQISHELTVLEAMQLPDITGMSVTLSNLSNQAGQLQPRAARPQRLEMPDLPAMTDAEGNPSLENWREAAQGAWEELKTLVVIRRHDEPLAPMLTEEQISLIRQMLKLKLEAVQVDLLKGDQARWSNDIAAVMDWLDNHFDPKQAALISMMQQLELLRATPIQPELPDISTSLQRLRQYAAKQATAGLDVQDNRRS